MAAKVRKQIYIEADQESTLKQIAGDMGISEAEIIRQAIDRYADQWQAPRRDPSAWERQRLRIQQLIDLGPVKGGRTWHREDLYDR
jgi:hypothetical protein